MTAPAALAGARVALLAPIGRPTPPVGYGPWEQVAYDIAEGLVARGLDVTLFATGNSRTRAHLDYVVPVGIDEDPALDGDVYGALHIAKLFARAGDFDLIHNSLDWKPLTYALAWWVMPATFGIGQIVIGFLVSRDEFARPA